VDVELSTTGADGKPGGQALRVKVLRIEQPKTSRILTLLPWEREAGPAFAETLSSELDARTDEKTGQARVGLTLDKGGIYRIRVTGTDRFGQEISNESSVRVSDDSDEVKLRIFAAESTLKVGQESVVRLHSRLERGLALITWEGETILHHRILELKKDNNEIPLTVGHELFPNFRLAVAAIDGRHLRLAAKEFTVERELKVAIKPAKEFFLPGEEGKVEIEVTDQNGRPVEAELSLALVNEALLGIYPDTLTPILDFFQREARRQAGFHAGATCGFRYAGTTRQVNRAIIDEAQRRQRVELEALQMQQARNGLRAQWAAGRAEALPETVNAPAERLAEGRESNERQTADFFADEELGLRLESATGGLQGNPGGIRSAPARRDVQGEGRWLPSIVTGSDGKAVATLSMPESTTAWRLTARGCSIDTLVGQATATTITRKDFFVSLKAPSFAREGDALRVVGRVHNLTDFAGAVPLTLRMLDARDRAKVLATREKSVEVTAKGGAEVVFDAITIPDQLEVVLELSAKAGETSDRLETVLPVQPWGLPYVAHAGGVATSDTLGMLELPGGRKYTSRWMTVSVGPELQGAVIDMAMGNSMVDTPMARILPPVWGGHPAHDLLAVASGLAYANAAGAGDPRSRPLVERARALVSTLVAGQNKEGRWDEVATDANLTARAFWALIAARDAGIAVHKPTLDQAAAALQKQFESLDANDHDGKAIILHALSCDKRADFAHCNRLYRERNTLGNATLAYLTRAFFNLDRKEIALELAGILESKAKAGDGPIALWESGCKVPWMNDHDETTAIVLLALAESKPESPKAEAAAAHLLQARGCFGFSSARARGPSVAALAAWFGKGKEEATDLEIAIQVNDKEIGLVKFPDRAGTGSSNRMLEIPGNLLADGKNRVEFKVKGRGKFTWAATLSGFSPDTKETGGTSGPVISKWEYYHAPLEYRGKSIGVNSTSVVRNLPQGDLVNVRMNFRNHGSSNRAFIIDIPLPAGARLLPESIALSDSRHRHEITATGLRVYGFNYFSGIAYDLAGYVPGQFRVLPATIREIGAPAFLSVGPTTGLTVLPNGEKSPDPYQMNIAERYALGKAHFDDGDDARALEYLAAVFKEDRRHNENEVARMLLWIYTKPGFRDAAKMVEMFEVLRERYPSLEIPFDKILAVAKAYRDLGEHERSWLVYRAVITASFANDSGISAVLEDEGRFLASIDFQHELWREYPDTADVVTSHFALSQLLFEKAPNAHTLPKEDGVQPEKVAMLKRTALLLSDFLALYPLDPLADDAGFSLCNCLLDLKDYAMVVDLSRTFAIQHAGSELAPGFQYMTALGLFWQNKNDEALAAARIVAEGESKDRDFARYILGQVFHATGKPEEAIRWYAMVKELYPDASEAIAYFEKKLIGLDEVTVFKPGQPVELTLRHRNIKEAFVQIYRVDLMKLYLQQKNLSAITSVQLAGIRPESEETIQLGDGKDYVEKEKKIPLKLKDEAAYLVICRGDDLFASGMVLITPLKIEIQEDPASGRVRANVLDTSKGGYRPEVHVKAIGSADSEFRSGETDLRGLFIADNLRGRSTVIAREGESRYAFFRGDTWLGAPENAPAQPLPQQMEQQGQSRDFKGNLSKDNYDIQLFNKGKFDENRRKAQSKGVKAEAAY
jgi:tetratricopeptide (TPR) repeat protein